MSKKVIYKNDRFRIVQIEDHNYRLSDILGDCFCPVTNPDIDPKKLVEEKSKFLSLVESAGVFGFELEVWNPGIDQGWIHLDSCWGFVGEYDEKQDQFNHYIVTEMKFKIEKLLSGKLE